MLFVIGRSGGLARFTPTLIAMPILFPIEFIGLNVAGSSSLASADSMWCARSRLAPPA
jgi:hypothetical protein